LGPLGTAAIHRPIVPVPGHYDDGELGGMLDRGKRSTRRKSAPVPLCPPQTTHTARTRARAAAVPFEKHGGLDRDIGYFGLPFSLLILLI
jgi:hypothetical protein